MSAVVPCPSAPPEVLAQLFRPSPSTQPTMLNGGEMVLMPLKPRPGRDSLGGHRSASPGFSEGFLEQPGDLKASPRTHRTSRGCTYPAWALAVCPRTGSSSCWLPPWFWQGPDPRRRARWLFESPGSSQRVKSSPEGRKEGWKDKMSELSHQVCMWAPHLGILELIQAGTSLPILNPCQDG